MTASKRRTLVDMLRSLKQEQAESKFVKMTLPVAVEECLLCNDTLDGHKVLPCGHSFCRACLMKWAATRPRNTISCPMDRAEFALPRDGIKGFPTKRSVPQRRLSLCSHGESRTAPPSTRTCAECQTDFKVGRDDYSSQYLCENCRRFFAKDGKVRLI